LNTLVVAAAVVYGLLIGSFLNAWAYRLPRGLSVARGRSVCPHCGAQIRAYDNIPVVSWLVLRGRCRDCGAPISLRYPVGEGLTAALFGLVAAVDGLSWMLVPHLLFVATLVLVSEVDLEARIIPDVIILPTAAIGLAWMLVLRPQHWLQWLVSGLGAAAFLLVVSWVYERVRGLTGLGMGDVKMALCMGFFLGAAVVPALFVAFIVGALGGLLLIARRGGNGKTAIPFGPFLAVGGVVGLFLGQPAIHWYLRFVLKS
jgi:leader peptidase (prepilin peptidase)/N-methyltransferase